MTTSEVLEGYAYEKRALEIAAAGRHHVLLVGPLSADKKRFARWLPSILPPMTQEEAVEAASVRTVAGSGDGLAIPAQRPFRAPPHEISETELVGGGPKVRPGEVSLAHQGVLFLEGIAHFRRSVLDALSEPLRRGSVSIARATGTVTFPAQLILVGSLESCPCGFLGDLESECTCTPLAIERHYSRIPSPILDRFDLHIEVSVVKGGEHAAPLSGDSSDAIRERVMRARDMQGERFRGRRFACNAQMEPGDRRSFCELDGAAERLLEVAINRLALRARAYAGIMKVARTVADLDGCARIRAPHLAEAIQYRSLDRGPL